MYKNDNGRCPASKRMQQESDHVKDLYLNEKKSMKEIAKMFETNTGVVQYFFKLYNIESRDKFDRPQTRQGKTAEAWEDIEEIKRLYLDEHWTSEEIGEKYNISKGTVYIFLKRVGIKIDGRPRSKYRQKKVWENVDKIIDMYVNDEFSCVEISKKFSCANNTIKRLLIRNNIKLRRYSRPLKTADAYKNVDIIINLHKNETEDITNIAEKFDVSVSTIKNILIKHNAFIPHTSR